MKYDAFISYRHSELDMSIAKKIHKGLETFKVPKSVAKIGGKSSIKRVFRDQEELPIGSDLGDNITSALQESEFLIVICSPRTPQSYWVNKEISTFISMHGRDHVLAVLIEGEPDESFPAELLSDGEGNPVEPLAADVRGKDDKEINGKLKVELLRLAAPILHCNYDDLRQRHRERKIKKIATIVSSIAAVAAVLGIAFGIYSARTAAIIKENYNQKLINQSKYLAETSMKLLKSGDREAAILVALEAVGDRNNPRPYVAQAEYALSSALYSYDLGNEVSMDSVFTHDLNVRDMDTDVSSSYLTTIDNSDSVYLWDIASRKLINKILPSVDKDGVQIDVLWANVFNEKLVVCDEEYVRSYSLDGQLLTEESLKKIVSYAYAKPDSENLYIWGNDNILIYSLSEFKITKTIDRTDSDTFSSSVLNSRDGKTLWIALWSDDVKAGKVLAYDIQSGKQKGEYKTLYNNISDMAETPDGALAVASSPYKRGAAVNETEDVIALEVFDAASGIRSFSTKLAGTKKADKAKVDLMARGYKDENAEHKELMLLIADTVYMWDASTYKSLGEINFGNYVSSLLISAGSSAGYAGLLSGDIKFADISSGEIYSDITVNTDKAIDKMLIRGGIIFIKSYQSKEITLLTYHEGSSKKEIGYMGEFLGFGEESPSGKYYVISKEDSDGIVVTRYNAKDDSEDSAVSFDTKGAIFKEGFFLTDDFYVTVLHDNRLGFVDFKKNAADEFVVEGIDGVDFCTVSNNRKYISFSYLDNIVLVDLVNRKNIGSFNVGGLLNGMVVSDDGTKIYTFVPGKGLEIIDVATKNTSLEETGKYNLSHSIANENAVDISEDGSRIAVACSDDVLRVLDTAKMKTLSETPFVFRASAFVKFMNGSDEIMLQGDDGVIKVFSVSKNELVFEDMTSFDDILGYCIDSDNNTIALVSYRGILLKDTGDYTTKSEVCDGIIYLPTAKAVIVNKLDNNYRFDLLSIEDLAESARNTVGRELALSEKVKYHID